jgi:uncharacterized phage-associated protein
MNTKNPLFDERRTAEAAAYLLYRAGGRLSVLKLMKLLYLAERRCLERYGEPLTGDKLVSMPHGPVLSMTLEYINGMRLSAEDGWDSWISARSAHMVALADPSMIRSSDDLTHFSDVDLEVLQETWDTFGHLSGRDLERYTHDKLPEWRDPNGSSQPISYDDVFKAVGFDANATRVLVERLEAQQHIGQSFGA